MKILIVDDNRHLVMTIGDIPEEYGYAVSTAYDGNSTIELCRKESSDLILIGYKLPDMNGLQLHGRLAELTDALYIFITAHGADDTSITAMKRKQVAAI